MRFSSAFSVFHIIWKKTCFGGKMNYYLRHLDRLLYTNDVYVHISTFHSYLNVCYGSDGVRGRALFSYTLFIMRKIAFLPSVYLRPAFLSVPECKLESAAFDNRHKYISKKRYENTSPSYIYLWRKKAIHSSCSGQFAVRKNYRREHFLGATIYCNRIYKVNT